MGKGATGSWQPAGGAVLMCQAGKDGKPKAFCDVDKIDLRVTVKDGATHTVTNSKRTAWETGAPPLSPRSEAYGWLRKYSVVIALETDFTTAAVGGGSGQGRIEGRNAADSKKASAAVRTAAAERCDLHPAVQPYSEKEHAARGLGSENIDLSISAVAFEYTEFFSRLWKWSGFSELVSPATIEKEFTVGGCAAPSSGRARGSFTALARLTARDEWRVEYSSPSGFTLKFGRSQSASRFMGGAKEQSQSTSLKTTSMGDSANYSSSSSDYRSGNSRVSTAKTSVDAKLSNKQETLKVSASHESASMTSVGSGDRAASARFDKAAEDMHPDTPGSLKKAGDWLTSKTGSSRPALSIIRNGKELSTADIDGMVKRVTETVESITDAVDMISRGLAAGMKTASPATLTSSVGFEFALLKGAVAFRHWRVPTAPLKGAAYYVETSDSRWTLGVDVTLGSGSLTASIEGQVKFVAAWIASGTISLEAKCTGKASIAFDIGKGAAPFAISGRGWYGVTVAATGDITVVAYYATLTAEVKGGVRYLYETNFDSRDLIPKRSRLRSERTTFSVKIMRGNKLAEFFGFGESKEHYKWPADGPLVLFEDDQFVKDFT